MSILVGLGSPLLDNFFLFLIYFSFFQKDIKVNVEGELLAKYGLEENGTVLIDGQNRGKLLPIFDEMLKLSGVEFLPGGSALNTIRVFQWILNKIGKQNTSRATFFGAIGDDHLANVLTEKAAETGIVAKLQRIQGTETGKCLSLIHRNNRSLCTLLGAADQFTFDFLQFPENLELIKTAQNFYVAAFFLSVCPEAVLHLAKNAAEHNKPFLFNLSAEYIPSRCKGELNAVLPFVDILFGNENEATAYAKANEVKQLDLHEIALGLANDDKINTNRSRIVIITRGERPVIVAQNEKIDEIPVISMPEGEFVDTNGAGDAFCGGFLAPFILGHPLDECLRCALFAAATIIRHPGCTFPKYCEYSDDDQ